MFCFFFRFIRSLFVCTVVCVLSHFVQCTSNVTLTQGSNDPNGLRQMSEREKEHFAARMNACIRRMPSCCYLYFVGPLYTYTHIKPYIDGFSQAMCASVKVWKRERISIIILF